MSSTLSVRISDEIAEELEIISKKIDRPKTYLVKKALEAYLGEYSDYFIALERLNDKDDEIISSKDMREKLEL